MYSYMGELTVWIVFPTVAIRMYRSSPLVPLDSCLTCCVVIEVFIIIIKQIVFFWYDCYRRWQGKETQLRSQSFILGNTIQQLTPLPRTGMFSKIWRAILVEVAGPKAPHWINLQTSHLLWTIIYFYKTPPSKGPVLYLIGVVKSSSSSSNYIFASLKSFNRTPKR